MAIAGTGCAPPDGTSGRDAPAEGAPATPDASGPEAVPRPDQTGPDEAGDPPGGGEWTAGRAARDRGDAAVATLRSVRTARHDAFDRVVLDFGGDAIPTYEVEYVDRPVRQCGSGDPVEIAGDGWLRIHVRPARAHTDEGEATITDRRRTLQLGVLRELVITCDFEAHLEWVAGVSSPNRFRVFELREPARLVIDIRHDGGG